MTSKVAVYGSLLRGLSNHAILSKAECLGPTDLEVDGRMVSLGYYPAMLKSSAPQMVKAEVYEVDEREMRSLDILEGHPSYYTREIIPTEFGDAWMYWLNDESANRYPQVPNNDWRTYVQ